VGLVEQSIDWKEQPHFFRSCGLRKDTKKLFRKTSQEAHLHSPGTRAKLFSMRILRKFISTFVILTVGFVSMNVAMVAPRRFPATSKPTAPLCPKHATHCCCPELCSPSKISIVVPGCHHTGRKKVNPGSLPSSQTALCFLKTGCGNDHGVTSIHPLLKDFVLAPWDEFGTGLAITFFLSAVESALPARFHSKLFHPPKTS
jgi:hypothetical protein